MKIILGAVMLDDKGNMPKMKETLLSDTIGLGLISYTVIKVFSGKYKDASFVTYLLSALFLVKFFLTV